MGWTLDPSTKMYIYIYYIYIHSIIGIRCLAIQDCFFWYCLAISDKSDNFFVDGHCCDDLTNTGLYNRYVTVPCRTSVPKTWKLRQKKCQVQATSGAFAATVSDGSIVTWGDSRYGGDSSGVHDRLRNVQQIHSTSRAFAAILMDGQVVTWGDFGFGGNCNRVREQFTLMS